MDLAGKKIDDGKDSTAFVGNNEITSVLDVQLSEQTNFGAEEKLGITDNKKLNFHINVAPLTDDSKIINGNELSNDLKTINGKEVFRGGLSLIAERNGEESKQILNLETDVPDITRLTIVDEETVMNDNNKQVRDTLRRKEYKFTYTVYVPGASVPEDDAYSLNIVKSPVQGSSFNNSKKKLLVFDLNGFLADVTEDKRYIHRPHKRVKGKLVFRRPFCEEFLKFCFERFDIGIWSSRMEGKVASVVDFVMGNLKHRLKFCWGQSKCTETGFRTLENKYKPLLLKELNKLWSKESNDLNAEDYNYSPSNTLLIDDSPYKAICNPPYTAIFPSSYQVSNEEDNSLDQGGDIRNYLEGLSTADDVQVYVRENPFGQAAITNAHPSWRFYIRVMEKVKRSARATVESSKV